MRWRQEQDGDARAVPVALRTVVDAVGAAVSHALDLLNRRYRWGLRKDPYAFAAPAQWGKRSLRTICPSFMTKRTRSSSVTDAPQLNVHLDIPDTLALQSAEAAQTLMRSAQEIITNTLRHAAARNLWLALRAEDGGVRLDSRDDGEGTDQLRLGHGLKGLRERFQQQGGQIAFESARGSGFRVMGWIPTRPSLP